MSLRIQGETTESISVPHNIGLLFLRLATIATLIYYELYLHLGKAYNNVWEELPWGLLDQFNNLNLPLPTAVAVAVILGSFLTGIGVLLGFLCRINSIILIIILTFMLVSKVQTSANFTPETIVLYLVILIALVINGPGRFSMDYLLTAKRSRRKA